MSHNSQAGSKTGHSNLASCRRAASSAVASSAHYAALALPRPAAVAAVPAAYHVFYYRVIYKEIHMLLCVFRLIDNVSFLVGVRLGGWG